jgi:hypothetical protein
MGLRRDSVYKKMTLTSPSKIVPLAPWAAAESSISSTRKTISTRARVRLAPSEELADPCSLADRLPRSLSTDEVAGIMGGNLADLMKVGASV